MSEAFPPTVIRKYIVNGSTLASINGPWIRADRRVAVFTSQWIGTGTPDGEFYVEGTNQNPVAVTSPTVARYYIDENKYTLTTATWATGTISVDSATDGNLSVTVEPVHPWVRLSFIRTDGGAVSAAQAQLTLKD